MSVRTKMLGFVDVILRVPPIFIIDEILKISMGLPFTTHNESTLLDSNQKSIIDTDNVIMINSSSILNSNNTSNNFSTIEQILNGTTSETLFSASTVTDDTEFYKILSLTSLKFLSCLLGECKSCWKINKFSYRILSHVFFFYLYISYIYISNPRLCSDFIFVTSVLF